jgi:hypothetical protein
MFRPLTQRAFVQFLSMDQIKLVWNQTVCICLGYLDVWKCSFCCNVRDEHIQNLFTPSSRGRAAIYWWPCKLHVVANKLRNGWSNFYEVRYGRYDIPGYSILLICSFPQPITNTWLLLEVVRGEDHPSQLSMVPWDEYCHFPWYHLSVIIRITRLATYQRSCELFNITSIGRHDAIALFIYFSGHTNHSSFSLSVTWLNNTTC